MQTLASRLTIGAVAASMSLSLVPSNTFANVGSETSTRFLDRPFMELVGYIEGPDGYDDITIFTKESPPKPITQMTINEVLDFQRKIKKKGAKSTAMGRFQFVLDTLEYTTDYHEIDRDRLFDRKMQDHLARLEMNRCGFYEKDKDVTELGDCLAAVWAALPMLGENRGKSRYDGKLNKSRTTTAVVEAILKNRIVERQMQTYKPKIEPGFNIVDAHFKNGVVFFDAPQKPRKNEIVFHAPPAPQTDAAAADAAPAAPPAEAPKSVDVAKAQEADTPKASTEAKPEGPISELAVASSIRPMPNPGRVTISTKSPQSTAVEKSLRPMPNPKRTAVNQIEQAAPAAEPEAEVIAESSPQVAAPAPKPQVQKVTPSPVLISYQRPQAEDAVSVVTVSYPAWMGSVDTAALYYKHESLSPYAPARSIRPAPRTEEFLKAAAKLEKSAKGKSKKSKKKKRS